MSLLFLFALAIVSAMGAIPPVATFHYFCLNQTSNVITFIGDVTSLYNASNPTTQWASIGLSAYPTLASELKFTSLSIIEASLPSTVPVPTQTFKDDINTNNNFVFPGQTQNTYQPLNTQGPVVAVQMINDSTTGYVLKMRFFFKIDVNALAQNCTSLGCTFQGSTNGSNNATIFRSTIPIYIMSRDSTGRVFASGGSVILTSSRETAGDDIVVTVSQGEPLYATNAFLDLSKIVSTGCSTGHVRAVLTIGMAYSTTVADGLSLVQGPLTASDVSVVTGGCYNFTLSKFTRPVCSTAACLAQFQLQTQCRPSTQSFLLCDNGQSGVPATWLDLNVQARKCTGAHTRPTNCTSNSALVAGPADTVWSSLDLNEALLQPIIAVSAYTSQNQSLSYPTPESQATIVALTPQGPDIAEYYPLAINTTSLSFTILSTVYSYAQMVANHFILFGVKASGGTQYLKSCGALLGCDSFVLNDTEILHVYPSAQFAAVSGIQPSGITTYAPLQISVQLTGSNPVPDIKPHNMFVIRNSYIALGVTMGVTVIAALIVLALVPL